MNRRTFLRTGLTTGLAVGLTGCASDSSDDLTSSTQTTRDSTTTTTSEESTTADTETTEDEPEIDRPANYRWDMRPGRNDDLRNRLSQYVEDSVGGVVQKHPAFGYSTKSARDDHSVDFEALKLYRDSNFDIFAQDPGVRTPLNRIVDSFVEDGLYPVAKNEGFWNDDVEGPHSYDSEGWVNAGTVEESLDYGHSLLVSIAYQGPDFPIVEQAVTIREAYKRHHDFDVLAWEVPMETGSLTQGMMYSPDDDTVRTFNVGSDDWMTETSRQLHAPIEDWEVTQEDSGLHHPILFHTDDWDRQGISFENAKDEALTMVFGIGTERYQDYNYGTGEAVGILNDITMTTAATEQLTRTLLEYNSLDDVAAFEDIWNLASFAIGKYIKNPATRGVIDTVSPEKNTAYDEYFDGRFSFYEVADDQSSDDDIIRKVRNDQAGEYDNFGKTYDALTTS